MNAGLNASVMPNLIPNLKTDPTTDVLPDETTQRRIGSRVVYTLAMKRTALKVVLVCAMAAIPFAGVSGCRLGGSVSTETALNQLRQENAALKEKATRAEGEAAELRIKLDAKRGNTVSPPTSPPTSPQILPPTLPVCTRIEIGGLSGWSKDGQSLELLVQTLDGRGRFVPVAATITVGVGKGLLPPLKFEPSAVREMYRSGVMGTYYLVAFPASRWAAGDVVTVEVLDEVTGQTHRAEWKPEPKSSEQSQSSTSQSTR